eukprot:11171726-Lingulodinium_polyedra.AAC.1
MTPAFPLLACRRGAATNPNGPRATSTWRHHDRDLRAGTPERNAGPPPRAENGDVVVRVANPAQNTERE